MPQIVWTAQANSAVDFFNQNWFDYTGLTPEESYRDAWHKVIHPEDLAETINRWMHSVQTGSPYDVENRFLRKDGIYRWHLARGLPLRNAKGHIVRWVGTCTDIQDQKEAQKSILAYKQQMELIMGAHCRHYLGL